jgi:Putative lactococcus lactis phage r1t holin
MFTRAFWRDAFERAARSGAWSLLGSLGGAAAVPHVPADWRVALISAGLGTGASLLASIAAGTGAVGRAGSPSFLTGQPPAPAEPRR